MAPVMFAVFVFIIFAGTLGLAPGTRTLTDIKGPIFAAGAVLLALGVVLEMCRRPHRRRNRGLAVFLILAAVYLSFTAVSALWALHPWTVKYAVAGQSLWLLLAACAAFVADGAGRRKTVAVSYALLGAAVSGFALVWHGLLAHTLNDVKAPLGNANLLGVFLILPIAMTVALAFREWRTRRRIFVVWLYALAGVLDIVVLGLCRSMSAWLGLFLYVGVLCLLKATKRARLALILVLACGASAGIFWLAGGFGHLYRTRTYLLRMEYWRRAAVMALERPVAGWGAGGFFTHNVPLGAETGSNPVLLTVGRDIVRMPLHKILGKYHPSSPHNEYLRNAAEGGIVGLLLYVALLGVPLATALYARRRALGRPELLDGAVAAYAGFLATNFVTKNMCFADFAPHFWILAGFLVSTGFPDGKRAPAAVKCPSAVRWGIAVLAVAAAGWGIYTFSIRDYISSMDYKKAVLLYRKGEFRSAATEYRSAAALTWDAKLAAGAQFMQGECYLSYGGKMLPAACAIFEDLCGKVDAYADFQLGLALERAGSPERAAVAYRRHLSARPWDRQAFKRLAAVEAASKRVRATPK